MSRHDAAITRFGQWAKRSKRAGYAFAQGAAMHGHLPERHWVRETVRAFFWGALLPVLLLGLALVHPAWLLLVLIYPAQVIRLAFRAGATKFAFENALFTTLGKFFEARGVLAYMLDRLRGRFVANRTG